jgi:hypothetical protein
VSSEKSWSAVTVFGWRIGWRQAVFSLFFAVFPPSMLQAAQTNEQAVEFSLEVPITLENANALDVLVDRFSREVTTSDRMVFDRFSGPGARLRWLREENRHGYSTHEDFSGGGARLFTTVGLDSLRIAAVEALPLDLWEDTWLRWLGHLITGAIGNPEEEHLGLVSGSYSAVRSSWESLSRETRVQWGIRPWRTYPYVYVLAHAGRMEGRPLLTLEGRAGYRVLDAPRIEARLTVQLPASFRIAGGAAFDPTRVGENEQGRAQFALTIEKVLGRHRPCSDAVFFVGFRSGMNRAFSSPRRESAVLAGLSAGW